MKMAQLVVSLCLLLAALTGVSAQCTIERFQNNAIDLLQSTEATDFGQTFSINRTIYNCLSTSQMIGMLNSMSVSILYFRSDTPNRLREIRYNMLCSGSIFLRAGQQSTALVSNDTRLDCSDCTSQTVNEYHCTACDSSCTGLNQCYGPSAAQCCSYNDDGNCVADCGMNREGNSTFHCVCSNFWTGGNCDDCSLNCTNGGTPESDCSTCQCVPGYNGTLCEIDIDECSSNPCQNNGTCDDGINFYNCTCVDSFTGTNCEIDIDECSSNPCQNNGTCTDGINSYACTCVDGYTGTDCETNIDECSPNPCQNNGTCTDSINSYACTCVDGYTGTDCETNIDECSPNPCQNNGTCTDGINSFTCTCVDGYTGTDCETNIDECSPNPCQNNGTCTDGINSFTCTCVDGYTGTDCETNIDECSPNPCQNNGTCMDGINSYNCSCDDGYTGTDCEANIDECSSNPCQNGGFCTDGINSYTCSCVDGYTGTNCQTDIDECSPNPCQNGGTCIDGINSYTCACVEDHTGMNCTNTLGPCFPNPCKNGGTCVDLINDYKCTCKLMYSGSNCSDGPVRVFNDTVIGDPLYEVPLNNMIRNETFPEITSLCYEIHGRAGQIFNLISDGCVQVNANYSAMDIPENGNIISQIGVLAYDTAGGCVRIMVGVNVCVPVVNGIPYNNTVYDLNGVTVNRRRNNRTRITVPNCDEDSDDLVFWVVCQNIMGQRMMKFQVLRGSTLRPDSHGLIGQFWNIPVTATGPIVIPSLTHIGVTYNVTVNPFTVTSRTFAAVLHHRTWERTLTPCFHAGNAQGGPISEVSGDGSVIEGEYFEYAVTDGIFGTNFAYNRLEVRTCPA